MTYIVKIRPKSDKLISLLKQIKELAANNPDIEIEEITEEDELKRYSEMNSQAA